jgi:hypothetical protein
MNLFANACAADVCATRAAALVGLSIKLSTAHRQPGMFVRRGGTKKILR